MLVSDFDFSLPSEAIAQQARPRGTSRLLAIDRSGADRHHHIADLPGLLRAGDLLVVNDTRVIPARLFARKRPRRESSAEPSSATGLTAGPTSPLPNDPALVELLLVERQGPDTWLALTKPGRRSRPGDRLDLVPHAPASPAATPPIVATVLDTTAEGLRLLQFEPSIEPHLDAFGHVPLPPYIKRPDESADRERYQTVWAREPGAIAAPTAGLHFTPEILAALAAAGIDRASVTLHVGIGTFKPVTATLVHEHTMEPERYEVPVATVEAIHETRRRGGRVVAVGTTVVRTLESAALADSASGHVYDPDDPATESPPAADAERIGNRVSTGPGRSSLFITPGFRFRVVDALVTNFHLPGSTLLMLVSALAGRERVLAAYQEAIENNYLFYSYGDAMLIENRWRP